MEFILDIVKLTNCTKPHQVTEQFILLANEPIMLSDFDNAESSNIPLRSPKKVASLIIASAKQKTHFINAREDGNLE